MPYCSINRVGCQVVAVEHAEHVVCNVLDRLIIVGCSMQLGVIVSAGKRESTYYVRISRYMDLDEPCLGWDSVFVSGGEGNEVVPDIVDEPFRWFDWSDCSSCCCTSISRGGRWLY